MLFALASAGCLWPTSLHDQEQAVNLPPYITFADPSFGTLTLTTGERTELKLNAIDPNQTDTTLYARLFLPGPTPGSRIFTFDETTLILPGGTSEDKIPTTPRSGALFGGAGAPLCALFPEAGDLFVRVADQKFQPSPNEDTPNGGAFVEDHWTLDCR